MAALCRARSLDPMYYEGALALWMRAKHAYRWDCEALEKCECGPGRCALQHRLLVALHLTIKFCGPTSVEYHATTALQASETWHGLTKTKLYEAEIDMCRVLNWVFF